MNENNQEIADCFARLAELFSANQPTEPVQPKPTEPTEPTEMTITPDIVRGIVKAYRVENLSDPAKIAAHKTGVAAIAAEHGKLDALDQDGLRSFRDAIIKLENPFG